MWNVIAGIYPKDLHVDRVSSYKEHENEFNVRGLEFPMQLNKIEKFEDMNNGYDDEKETVFPQRISRKVAASDGKSLDDAQLKCNRYFDLLMYTDGEESHYPL